MALETAVTINQLDPANPAGPDRLAQGDDHIRLIKAALKATFPNITGPMTLSHTLLNSLAGLVVPVGTIQLWYGTSDAVPAGYALCDGRTVAKSDGSGNITVPDMRGRVPVGATDTHAVGATFGQDSKTITSEVAGGHTHTGSTTAGEGAHAHGINVEGHALTINEMPPHSHSLDIAFTTSNYAHDNTSENDHTVQPGGIQSSGYIGETGLGQAHTHAATTAANSGAHQHSLALDAVAAHAHAATVDVTQASIAVHYIMRV